MASTTGLHKGAFGTNRVTTFCTRAFKVNRNTCHLQMVFFGFLHSSHAFKHRSKYFVCWCEIQIRWNSFISKNRRRLIKCLFLKLWWQCTVLIKIRTQIIKFTDLHILLLLTPFLTNLDLCILWSIRYTLQTVVKLIAIES